MALSCQTNAIRGACLPATPAVSARARRAGASLWGSPALAPATGDPTLRRKSSQYGLYRLGYTRATRAEPTGRDGESLNYPQRQPQFGLRAATRTHEAETVSNRASKRHGEDHPSSAHTAHHARIVVCTKGLLIIDNNKISSCIRIHTLSIFKRQ